MAVARPTSKLPPGANRILFVKTYHIASLARTCNEAKTKGTAFVVFDDVMDAKNALEHLNGFHLQERYIVVLYHMPTKQEAAAKADLERREKELEEMKKRHDIGDE